MSKVTAGDFPGKSVVNMLPIIDVNPGDMSCIFSTLTFIINQAKELNITTPVLTFDQPLWLKANEIKYEKHVHCVNTRRFSYNDELLWKYRNFNGRIWSRRSQ